jgi:hypothetical protein
VEVAPLHRIEQPRHQRQPLPLAFLVMIKNVLWHAVPARFQLTTSGEQTPGSPGNRLRLRNAII